MRAHKYVIFFLLCLFKGPDLYSQELDDQITSYEKGNIDEKIGNMMFLHNKVASVGEDSVLYFIKDLQDEGIENDREDAIALSNYVFGHYLNDKSLFSEAIDKLLDAERYYAFAESDSMLAAVYNALGNNYYLQSERKKAEEYYLKSIAKGEESGVLKFEALSFANLSRIYIAQEKYTEAKKLLDEYIELNKSESKIRNLGTAYGLYGQFYLNQKKFDKAIEHLERSMEYNLSTGNNELIGNGYTNLAIAAYFKEDLERAKDYFDLALAYREKSGSAFYIAESYFNIGDFYFGSNQLDSAEVAYHKSLKVARDADNKVGEKDALMQLSVLYDSLNLHAEEVKMLKEYIEVEEELNQEKISRELATMRISFDQDLEQKEYLTQQRESKLRNKIEEVGTVWDYWIWIVLICVLTISGFVFVSYQRTSRNKKK